MYAQSHGHLLDTRRTDRRLNTRDPIRLSDDISFDPMHGLATFASRHLVGVGILIPEDVAKLVIPFREAGEVWL